MSAFVRLIAASASAALLAAVPACAADGDGGAQLTGFQNEQRHTPPPVLTRTDAAGAECPDGGQIVRAGADQNRNGELDDAEVEHSTVVCKPKEIFEGDLTVSGADDALRALRVVHGSLIIDGDAAIDLPALEVVTGDVRVARAPAGVALPALDSVGGELDFAAVESFSFPALARVGGKIQVPFDSSLASFSLPALVSAGASIEMYGSALTRVELPVLPAAGDVNISGSTALAQVDLRNLFTAGALRVAGQMTSLDLTVLNSTESLELRGFGAMPELDLPSLHFAGAYLAIGNLGEVTSITVPGLSKVDTIRIQDGGQLQRLWLGDPMKFVYGDVGQLGLENISFTDDAFVSIPSVITGETTLYGSGERNLHVLEGIAITGKLTIKNNGALVDFSGLYPGIEIGAIEIADNAALTSLAGLELVSRLNGDLLITSNGALRDVSGLGALAVIGGELDVIGNGALPGFAGWHLQAVGGDLNIVGNDAMTSLAGLERLSHAGTYVEVSGAALPASEIDAFLARVRN